ncbi:hypothetical protein GQ44DRAFT_704930 [Phaeosphaeriaceae sp. PMI808]|nr:hypothetical protein GQ44DRAFT_704930 [Phaeosphaeriaceae sp. PMI808]
MAGLFHDVERDAAISDSSSPSKPTVYGTVHPIGSSSRDDSPLDTPLDTPLDLDPVAQLPRPGYTHPHQHRIIPPSITGHGRLIVAHRVVPYWVGTLIVLGTFAWAVWCARYIYPLLKGYGYQL